MIAYLKGILRDSKPTQCIIEVGGIGFEVSIALSTHSELPQTGNTVFLYTHLHIREEHTAVYGFATPEEKSMFLMLIGVSKIGPKGALSILSGIPISEFQSAVVSGDSKRIAMVPGIGKKTAERLIVELKEKVAELGVGMKLSKEEERHRTIIADAVKALLALGYPQAQAQQTVRKVIKDRNIDTLTIEDLVKWSLQQSK